MITTQKELRAAFWDQHIAWKPLRRYKPEGNTRPATQNEYPAYIRMAWVDFVEHMHRSGQISDALANRATL